MSDRAKQFKIQLDPVQVKEAVAAYVKAAGMGTATGGGARFHTTSFFSSPIEIDFTGYEVIVESPLANTSDTKGKT